MAVTPTRCMPSTSEGLNGFFGRDTRHQSDAEQTQHAVGVKDGKGVLQSPFADKRAWDTKVRGLLHLLLSSPEYQLG